MLHLTTVDSNTYALLQQIFTVEIIKNNFALAGGTALALQIGHRKSIDLDIFNTQAFDVKELEIILSTAEKFKFSYTVITAGCYSALLIILNAILLMSLPGY
ncbi:MAG: nucleotidyl transferase AbiEii/AbiGii toxin family protein [Ferruginibacter sp.]